MCNLKIRELTDKSRKYSVGTALVYTKWKKLTEWLRELFNILENICISTKKFQRIKKQKEIKTIPLIQQDLSAVQMSLSLSDDDVMRCFFIIKMLYR